MAIQVISAAKRLYETMRVSWHCLLKISFQAQGRNMILCTYHVRCLDDTFEVAGSPCSRGSCRFPCLRLCCMPEAEQSRILLMPKIAAWLDLRTLYVTQTSFGNEEDTSPECFRTARVNTID